jgi:hypothetical protein
MLYLIRTRMKESSTGADINNLNRVIDDEVAPALMKIEGVRSVEAYNSITGELVMLLEIENLAAVDRTLSDPGVAAVAGKWLAVAVRTGGEILYDRPAWQGLYGEN